MEEVPFILQRTFVNLPSRSQCYPAGSVIDLEALCLWRDLSISIRAIAATTAIARPATSIRRSGWDTGLVRIVSALKNMP